MRKIYSVDRQTELKNGKVISDAILITSEKVIDGGTVIISRDYFRVELSDMPQLLEKLQRVKLD